jgi:NAD(P)-dependent dehydrogenase (short-subunit alcohol dehydrogenase family)
VRNPEQLLDGRVAVVTGAGRGIGRAIAVHLAGHGANVVLGARSSAELERVREEIVEASSVRAIPVQTDVTDPDSVERLMDVATQRLGSLDVLVCNAGVIRDGPLADASDEDWDIVLNTNLRGAFFCLRAALPKMERGGSVITVSSIFGEKAVRNFSAYCVSKAGLIHLTKVAALEHARRGVRVNTVAPGYVATDLNAATLADPDVRSAIESRVPWGSIAAPEDLVALVSYLASDAASYVTGAVFPVDGGLRL